MELHHDNNDIIIMKETKTHIKKKRSKRPRPSTSSSTTTTNSDIDFTMLQNNEEDVANCLILLAHGRYDQPPVYECKTCNRGFASFQALGGHRLTHKKPTHEHIGPSGSNKGPSKPLSCNPSGSSSSKGPKVHECSICGSDFASGQALGGHMRRHRSVMPTNDDGLQQKFKKHKTLVPLDLNLPAPIEDDDRDETKFSFGSNNQIIVCFSAPSLVDCQL